MDNNTIHSLLFHHFNISNAHLKKLDGYESLNYKITTTEGEKFVLKIHTHSYENEGILQAENEMMLLLGKEMPSYFAKPIPNIKGEFISKDEKTGYKIRLLSFLEGTFLADVDIHEQHLSQLGSCLGKMDRVLSNYHHPAIASRVLIWDLQYCLSRQECVTAIPLAKNRAKVVYFFAQYQENVSSHFHKLRKSTIHGDANDWNVLEQNGHISGFIDFGDMAYTPLINELAIAIPYAIFGKENPIECAAIIVKAYHQEYPLEELELELLYYLIGARLAVSLSHSAFFNEGKTDDSYITISEKTVWTLLEKWLTINPIYAVNAFKKVCDFPTNAAIDIKKELKRRRNYFNESLSLSYQKPIKMSSAAFQYMYAADGTTFLDAYNNIPIVGHCHPKVVEAGQRQMAKLNTNTRYIYDALHEYSEKLLAKFPSKLNKVFFVNSGSAASDLAIRMAKVYHQHSTIAVLEHGYHGNTQTAISISSYKFDRKGGKGANHDIIKLPMPDEYRGKYRNPLNNTGSLYAKDAIEIIQKNSEGIAAFIAESIMGCGGQIPLPQGYLKEMFAFIRNQGGLCIVDEVQIGFGRVGTHFWGFEQHNVVPDMVILGKPIGNGHPMGAVVCTEEVANRFANGMEFFSSFGGNPVSCAIGNAVLDVIEEEGLQQHSLEVGTYIMDELKGFQKDFNVIGDVRGSGLFWGIELIHPKKMDPNTVLAGKLKNSLREKNILISTDGPFDNVLKSKPPLCFDKQNADQLLGEILESMKKLC
ncbi:MAG: ethanolamine-phosphate phospho-lyase [Maribacter sp.]|jgi:ethanolamine-phosphate phospho-lyase